MDIDRLLANVAAEKLTSDCPVHDFLRTYMKKKAAAPFTGQLGTGGGDIRLRDYSAVLGNMGCIARCFPDGCAACEGLAKCANCIHQDQLADTVVKLYPFLGDSG